MVDTTTYVQKKDQGKTPLALLDPYALTELAKVLEFGATKYEADGWRNGVEWRRTLSALLRHTFAFMDGQDFDPETGLPHPAHIMCNAMFLVRWMKDKREFDNRHKDESGD